MNSAKTSMFLLCLAAAASRAAEERVLLLSDDFEGRSALGPNYRTALVGPGGWVVKDGVLVGRQTNPDHGAIMRREMNFADIDIEIDFRFSGGTGFNFVIDDANERSVHAGHICRVAITPKSLRLSDDKTGAMNLEVQAQRNTKELPADKKRALDDLLKRTQAAAVVALKHGEWHRLRVRIAGDLLEASVDRAPVARLLSPGIAHATKTKFGLTVNGATIDFDNLQVFQVGK